MDWQYRWPATHTDDPLRDKISRFLQNQGHLMPWAQQLSVSDRAISYDVYHIKALVGMLNGDISL